ncbi:hypothetical protein [Halobacillus seohaensis]|uniref:Uncharacterized protein n=1 Tax=Halobacillus seohaensis TaxID=447421 RepID=A0ABW2EHB5_9BACI
MSSYYNFNLGADEEKKKKFNIYSLVSLVIFVALFTLMVSGFGYWGFGRVATIFMLLFPLIGVVLAFKGKNLSKWLLILFNLLAFLMMAYILLLALGIGGG